MAADRIWIDAHITPNAALSHRALALISLGLLGPALLFGGVMIALRLWPAGVFLGAEVLAACGALYWCGRRLAEQGQRVVLTDDALVVESWDKGCKLSAEQLDPTWARIERRIHPAFGCEAVLLHVRGKVVRIAHALSPDERLGFADALEQALLKRKTNLAQRAA
jgi:uncharacterized membrane protein